MTTRRSRMALGPLTLVLAIMAAALGVTLLAQEPEPVPAPAAPDYTSAYPNSPSVPYPLPLNFTPDTPYPAAPYVTHQYSGVSSPAAPFPIRGIDCVDGQCALTGWGGARPMNWQPFAQGEYVGHPRLAHVPEYRLRVDDLIEFMFRITRDEQSKPYKLNVGDSVRVESFVDETLNRDAVILPDGTIILRLIGAVRATRHTVDELRNEIEQRYTKFYRQPSITVIPLQVNTKLDDLRATYDNRAGLTGGQSRQARVTPEGTIALPAIGSVPAQGLTLAELKREIEERYSEVVDGGEITPVLVTRAPRYVYVLGQVTTPGRYELVGPTTTMQSISMAGGVLVGGNLRQVVIFRRGDDWRLMATMLDLRAALLGKVPCPTDEVWINDSDIVLVPKAPIRVFDDIVSLVFTDGLYAIAPFSQTLSYSLTSILNP